MFLEIAWKNSVFLAKGFKKVYAYVRTDRVYVSIMNPKIYRNSP
ncbi:hypothetical protein MGA3_12420 [Bacillus methanolicus MGA3]|nr:hypothetical protein MGA3_12420 [Bacillus methanolicus MGA3]